MNAPQLASKVNRIILKHIRSKGYEADVVVCSPIEKNRKKLSIENEEDGLLNEHRETIKVVITSHGIDKNSMELGDNPIEKLSFIVINDTALEDRQQVKESRIIEYDNKRFEITLVSPATLGGQLIIKECEAEKVI